MKNGFIDDLVRKTRFLARALSSLCVLAAGLPAQATTPQLPGIRTAVPSIYYLGVSLTYIVVTYLVVQPLRNMQQQISNKT